jgi:carbon monoxide dehydrogenase subunit G
MMILRRFEAVSRLFASEGTRRAAIAALVGGGLVGSRTNAAAKKRRPKPLRSFEISGERVLLASPEDVFAALTDPDALAACISGIGQHSEVGADEYEGVIQVGPAKIGGSYQGSFKIEDKVEPSSYRIIVSAAGQAGTASGEAEVDLAEELGNTLLSWDGNAQLSGKLAKFGGKVSRPAANALVNQFLNCFAANL